jgi:hypothetical protein
VSVLGLALTLVLPEPAGRSLEDLAAGPGDAAASRPVLAGQAPAS